MEERTGKYRFPALLGHDDATGRYYVLFPDLPGCTTTGDSEEEATANASEAMSLHLYGMEKDGDEIPTASRLSEIETDDNEVIFMVDVWMPSFRERMETKAVNRTVTLPGWLDGEAKRASLNYSQILQDGIMERLNISRVVARNKKAEVAAG